ncbi:hypothetical protein [Pseudomonas nitroreducens]|uniref:Uncharacterized protein n=1 Tax=Pseudomonas nitroreducens TaxID=46680 RepID=A0A6G6IXR2_PSENT|nr:hypothetical protein [Pseudomonas nitroreducens]QIE87996.1 hypothetical protein G5B91_17630 [Pseudomonas nitroreducens]
MKLNSARIAWHDCMYSRWDSQASVVEQLGILGRMVQTTERDRSTDMAIHQALAGRVQGAISTLPPSLQAFGHHLYGPGTDDDLREAAEEVVFTLAYSRGERMYAKKFERARYVAAGVLERYRRMHQGGQSAMPDPIPNPEAFRAFLLARYGVIIDSRNWAREWEPFVEACFLACDDLDKEALVPVSTMLAVMREAA